MHMQDAENIEHGRSGSVTFPVKPRTINMLVIVVVLILFGSVINALVKNNADSWSVVAIVVIGGGILGYRLRTRPPRLTITSERMEIIQLHDARQFGFADIDGQFELVSLEGGTAVCFALTKEFKQRTRFGLHMISGRFDYSIADNYAVSPTELERVLNRRLSEWRGQRH